jgi:hypothetical protein
MRDLLDKINRIILDESVGLANRKPGTKFANPNGDEIIFSDLSFYPESGSFGTPADMEAAISQWASGKGISPESLVWSNQPRNARAFGVAHFVDDQNQDYYIGRYFQKISPIRTENNFPNNLPGGFKLQTKVAQKEAAGYKPTDVLRKLDDLTPEDVVTQIRSHFGPDSDEARAAEIFVSSQSYPIRIPLGKMNFTAFTNYFCEMLQPMALVLGKKTTGSASQAEKKFLTQGGYTTCRINYGASKTGGLTDSTLVNPAGQVMGLSSKAELGAKASSKNLLDKVDDLRKDEDGRKLLEQYQTEISLLETLTEGSTPGSLNGAVIAGIITPEEKNQIMAIRNLPAGSDVVGNGLLSDRLEDMYNNRKARDPKSVIPFFHIRAAIANQVADWVNNNTDFSGAASAILNWGAFIQAYTFADQKGEEIILKPFDVVWPSTAVTGVLLSADKTFYSTGSKGNFVFKILYNGASDTETELDDAAVDTKPDVDLDQITRQKSGVTARAGGLAKNQPDEKSFGRKRRR